MADTHGFDTVVEATRDVLVQVLKGAWKSAECPVDSGNEGRFPEHKLIDPGLTFGAFAIAEGDVHVPQEELDAFFLPAIQSADLKFGLHIHAVVKDPPVLSARLLDMTADLHAHVPIGLIAGTKNVGLLLAGLPRASISATLTSGDPLAAKLNDMLADFVHAAYENGAPGVTPDPRFPTLPHEQSAVDHSIPLIAGSAIIYDAFTELFDDLGNPVRRIETTAAGGMVTISIPIHLKIYNIRVTGGAAGLLHLLDPMGIETRLVLTAPLTITPGRYAVDFTSAAAAAGPIAPAGPGYGVEGGNYTTNKSRLSVIANLDTVLQDALKTQGQDLARGFGARGFNVPTVAQIEDAIGNLFFADLSARGNIGIWTPEAAGALLNVTDVTTFVGRDTLAIAINAAAGADVSALGNLVPAGMHFAIAVSRGQLDITIARSRHDEGLADDQLPKRLHEDDKDVDLKSFDVAVTDGAIRLTGMVTVIDAILDSIDVDADFTENVGFHWEPNATLGPADAPQMMQHHTIGDPDVDPHESVLLWIITIILVVITVGAGGGLAAIIEVIIALIVRSIANNIGSNMVVNAVTGAVVGISGWPRALSRIGHVRAVFHDPVTIEATGLVVAGTMQVISSCEATTVVQARSGGPYTGTAASALTLTAGATAATAQYAWSPSLTDAPVAVRDLVHVFPLSGRYIARHTVGIAEPGGATTLHYALVDISNVPPELDAGPDLEVDEGQVVTLTARFTDIEYADTHEATWNFGDAQPPQLGLVTESNVPPRAAGTVTTTHAWCTEGRYTVTVTLRDQNGGVALDTLVVTVRNLPPVVDAGPDMFAYPCMVLTLTAAFTDPGWCDRHTATWEFGACAPPQTAVVEEFHTPPAGHGTATASTIYECCGTYRACCEVIDDAGASDTDCLAVQVVTLANPGFEEGYRATTRGRVANGWQDYAARPRLVLAGLAAPVRQLTPPRYACEECVVHDGQRSQQVQVAAEARAGLWQRLGANPGWDYQFTAWVMLAPGSVQQVRLGLDPAGGGDATAPDVLWTDAAGVPEVWTQLCIRGTATADGVSLFLDAEGECSVWFDDVAFVARQPFCPPVPPKPDPLRHRCVEFVSTQRRETLGTTLAQNGYLFESQNGKPLAIIAYGNPAGRPKLAVTPQGIAVRLPGPSRRVEATISQTNSRPFTLLALDATNATLDVVQTPAAGGLHLVVVAQPGIMALLIRGQEGGLVSLCATPMPSEKGEAMPASTDDPPAAPPAGEDRLDPTLRRALRNAAPGSELPVVISLPGAMPAPPAPVERSARRAMAAQAEASFAEEVKPLIRRLEAQGATGIASNWLSRSVTARLRPDAVRELASHQGIDRIVLDEPRRILLHQEPE